MKSDPVDSVHQEMYTLMTLVLSIPCLALSVTTVVLLVLLARMRRKRLLRGMIL